MKRCFVIGPIGDKMAPLGSPARSIYEEALSVYEDVIRPACEANDLEAIRADGIAVPGEITEQIFRHLYEDEVVIADVSGGNPNVMYELGLRHTRDLLTIQIGEYGQLPFDVRALRTIMFSRSERGLIEARKELETVLRVGLAEGSDPLPATRLWLSRAQYTTPGIGVLEDVESAGEVETEEPDDRGFVERMVAIEEGFPALTECIESIGEVLTQLGSEADDLGVQMETLNSSGAPASQRLAIITRYGQSLREPADSLTAHTERFAGLMTSMDVVLKGLLRDIAENPEIANEDTEGFLDSIVDMAQSTREGMESLNEFGTTVGSLGRISKALRRPGEQMGKAIRTMAAAAGLMDEWEAGVFALRARMATDEGGSKSGTELHRP